MTKTVKAFAAAAVGLAAIISVHQFNNRTVTIIGPPVPDLPQQDGATFVKVTNRVVMTVKASALAIAPPPQKPVTIMSLGGGNTNELVAIYASSGIHPVAFTNKVGVISNNSLTLPNVAGYRFFSAIVEGAHATLQWDHKTADVAAVTTIYNFGTNTGFKTLTSDKQLRIFSNVRSNYLTATNTLPNQPTMQYSNAAAVIWTNNVGRPVKLRTVQQ